MSAPEQSPYDHEADVTNTEDATVRDELVIVEAWRLSCLLGAGYEFWQAERLAAAHVDLHTAVEMITKTGCPPQLAFEILI